MSITISAVRPRTSILDKSLSRGRGEVSVSCFSLLFSELVQYCQNRVYTVPELQNKLAEMGQEVGVKVIDLFFVRERNCKREIKLLNMLLFIKSTLWKALLKELITEDVTIIECKQTDTNTNKAKTKAWQKIHNRFTELNGRGRSFMELKQQWRCMKLDAKKSISAHRQALTKTGGGPKPPSPSKDTLELVELLPLEFEVDHNEFDSDSLPFTVEYDDSTSNAALPPSMQNTPIRGGIGKNKKRKMRFQALFGKEADKLEHANDDERTYYIIEKDPLVNKFISVPKDKGSLNCSVFTAGIIEAVLNGCGFPAKVTAHWHKGTTYMVKFEDAVIARDKQLEDR